MATINLNVKDDITIIHIEGQASIDTAAQIHTTFIEALKNQLNVILDLNKVSECDSSFVQLLRAFCFSLEKNKLTLECHQNSLPASILNVIKTLGFQFRCNCIRIDKKECTLTDLIKFSEQHQEVLK